MLTTTRTASLTSNMTSSQRQQTSASTVANASSGSGKSNLGRLLIPTSLTSSFINTTSPKDNLRQKVQAMFEFIPFLKSTGSQSTANTTNYPTEKESLISTSSRASTIAISTRSVVSQTGSFVDEDRNNLANEQHITSSSSSPVQIESHVKLPSKATLSSFSSSAAEIFSTPTTRKQKVLALANATMELASMQSALQRMEYEVTTLNTVKSGLDLLHRKMREQLKQRHMTNAFDIVVMDLHMNDMDGIEAISSIRSYEKSLKPFLPDVQLVVVGLSRSTDENDIREAMDAGCDIYLEKPFKLMQFQPAIEKLMKKA
jgi:CheY-like chemotaxis protein